MLPRILGTKTGGTFHTTMTQQNPTSRILINPRAILEGRSSSRAPVPWIIGLVVSGICTHLALLFYLVLGGPNHVAIGLVLALPTACVLIGLVLLLDRLEPEPPITKLLAFAWGAGVAILGALIVNDLGEALLRPALGKDQANFVTTTFCAPVVEESFKGSLLLILLLWWKRRGLDGPTDGVIYASLVGLGFALIENVLYYVEGLEGPGQQLVFTVILRGVIAPLGHPLYTSMTGLGVAYAAVHRGPGRFFAVVGGWLAAVLLHMAWNASTSFGPRMMALAYLVQVLVLVTLVVVLIRDRRRIVSHIQTYLPAYIPSGLVQSNDVRMLGTMSGRREARRWARTQAGVTGARAMADYQLAATELALLHAHTGNGAIEARNFYARREGLLRLMRVARDAFFRRTQEPPAPPWARSERSGFFTPPSPGKAGPLPAYRAPRPASVPPGQRPGAAGRPGQWVPFTPSRGTRNAPRPPSSPPGGPPPGRRF